MNEWTKLNLFQRLVRHWDALHPYNAAQAMRLVSCPDAGMLTAAWRQTLAELGLGRLHTAGHRYRFECLNGDADRCSVQWVGGPDASLESFMTVQLNQRFTPEELPLRAFAIDGPGGPFIGVVYHHWVADSASIRLLLREWFYRLYDPARAMRRPLRIGSDGYWQHFGPMRGGWSLDEGLLTSLRWSSRLKRVRRVERSDFDKYRTHFTLHEVSQDLVEDLHTAARRRGVTLHDLFLAAAAEICDRFGTVDRTRRRQDLALGSIVDLRARGRDDLSDVFGLFLGFTSVICRPRDLHDWERLLQRIALQSRMHKRNGAPEASIIRMLAGIIAHHVLGPEGIKQFYRKRLPLAGGVSNVNLNGTWVRPYHPDPIRDYLRVAPSGPMMPLVFTPTTLGGRLNVGLTCRASVVSPERAREMSHAFADRLLQVVHAPAVLS